MKEIVWLGVDEPSTERCRVSERDGAVHVHGSIERTDGTYDYELLADSGWQFRRLTVSHREESRTLSVVRNDDGWHVDDQLRPDLKEAIEVDISASPFSNTLPIRRLDLAVGQSKDIVTAYVAVPELTVATDPQRYTRISVHEWLYESRDSDFRCVLTVDGDGLVMSYPGLFERS